MLDEILISMGLFVEEWIESFLNSPSPNWPQDPFISVTLTVLLKLSAISLGFWRSWSWDGRVIWNTICFSDDMWLRHRARCFYLKVLLTTWNGPFRPSESSSGSRETLVKLGESNTLGKKLAEAPKCLWADRVLYLHWFCSWWLPENHSFSSLAKHKEQEP